MYDSYLWVIGREVHLHGEHAISVRARLWAPHHQVPCHTIVRRLNGHHSVHLHALDVSQLFHHLCQPNPEGHGD
jgi:hypothetical protein